jgi:hypothetical protein
LLQLRIVEIALEALCVQTDRFGDLQEALSIDERRFFLIKGIVHFPEVPLVASSLGSNRCEFGTGMGTNFSASTCMSSSAKIMSASGIRPQRRICSRRAPSDVVRLQSMPSVCESSSVRIVVFPGPKLLDVRRILLSIGFLFQRSIVACADDTPVAPV